MARTGWLLIVILTLFGCGSASDDSSSASEADSEDSQWADEADDGVEDTVETGSLSIDLPGDHGSGRAYCNMNLTRIVASRLASVMVTLDVFGKGCDGMGNCDNPNMRGGDFTYSGGIDGDKPFATMILNYGPPGDSEEEVMWMFNVLHNSKPFSRFDLLVDGEPFNVLTSDTRDAEDFAKGPHVWDTKIEIEADMLRTSDADDPATPGLQTRAKFLYEGPCEIYAKYMQP